MAEYLGKVALGGLQYANGQHFYVSSKPWQKNESIAGKGYGDLEKFVNTMSFNFINTPSNSSNKLQWVKIRDGNKMLYICDRNLFYGISWDELNKRGLVNGKEVTIDGKKYKVRLLTGGTRYRNSDYYAGATPTNNEWDRFVVNEENISGLPKPLARNYDSGYKTSEVADHAHNKMWNWTMVGSWCQEESDTTGIVSGTGYKTMRGERSGRYYVYSYYTGIGGVSGWRPVLEEQLNTPPTISGTDSNLGDKNTGFSVNYTVNDVDNNTLTVTEKLGGTVLRTLSNAPKGQTITLTIPSDKLYTLPLNTTQTITIQADDGQGAVVYRYYTFRRINTAPIISGANETIGVITAPFNRTYTVNDNERDSVRVTEYLDSKTLRTYTVALGATQTIELTQTMWKELPNGNHTFKIEATDGKATSVRLFSFEKKETKILFKLTNPFPVDRKPMKIMVTPTWKIEGATAKIEVCNNAFDSSPIWEDMTAQAMINQKFFFQNATKTADKWGINIRITIQKNAGYTGEVNITGLGGAYD